MTETPDPARPADRPTSHSAWRAVTAEPGESTGVATAVLDETALEPPSSVVVWDDPVNLMSYVVLVFKKVFPDWPKELCEKKMLEVHNDGRSIVFIGARDEAEVIASKLQSFQLWATVQR